MAKVVVDESQNWAEIARQTGCSPKEIMFEPSTSELEVPGVDQSELNVVVANYSDLVPTNKLKQQTIKQIDSHCQELISRGFEWPVGSGKILSLSNNAQLKWLGLFVHFQLPVAKQLITFPLDVPTKDDMDSHNISDIEEVENIYSRISGIVASYLDGAQSAKAAVNAAITIGELEAARDAYLAM